MKKGVLVVLAGFLIILGSLFEMELPLADSKPTVLYFYRQGCRFCDEFEYLVLSKKEVKEELSKFNFKKINAAQRNNYNVSLTPTVIILNKNNVQVDKFIPPLNKREFIKILRKNEE